MALLLQLPSQTRYSTSLSIQPSDVTGTQILASFDTMPGNQPQRYGDTLFLWQTGAQIVPANMPPLRSEPIGINQPDASWLFMGLDLSREAYLVGLGLGADPVNVASTVFIPPDPGATSYTAMNPSVEVTSVASDSVAFTFATPTGQMPKLQGDWVGLWDGLSEGALYTVPPTWSAPVPTNAAQGQGSISAGPAGIVPGTTYTLGYFKGGWQAAGGPCQTTLACSATFIA